MTGLDIDLIDSATFRRDGRELVVTPHVPIEAGSTFTTVVRYHGSPEPRTTKALPIAVGWIATGDGSYVLSEPEGASTWYPVNDHPSDKATYSFHITVPNGVTAVANGDLVSQVPATDGYTTWNYDMKAPMASYLSQVVVGNYTVTNEPGPNGVTIRNVFESSLANDAKVDFSRTPDMLQLFATDFGPYPFDIYGALVVNDKTNYELETQTLSLFDSRFASGSTSGDELAAHELAHQWFGDSISLSTWKDIWLNEGFATYAQWLWNEHVGRLSVETAAKQAYDGLASPSEQLTGDPGVEHLFDNFVIYQRGAVTLQALRLTVGDDAFFNILRTYVARFTGKNATTADFIAVANEVAGRDLSSLFDAWLYKAELPALPS